MLRYLSKKGSGYNGQSKRWHFCGPLRKRVAHWNYHEMAAVVSSITRLPSTASAIAIAPRDAAAQRSAKVPAPSALIVCFAARTLCCPRCSIFARSHDYWYPKLTVRQINVKNLSESLL